MRAMNVHEKKGWIERLQALDEPIKQRVLIISTVIIMMIVIYFWLAYFNNLVAGIATQPTPAPASDQAVAPAAQAAPTAWAGIWENMKGGMAFLVGQFLRIAHGFADILKAPRQYIIQPPQ